MEVQDGQVYFRPMSLDDLEQVLTIEEASFPAPWSRHAFQDELTESRLAHYWVAVHEAETGKEEVIGYAGLWLIFDEVHVTTIAITQSWRQQGLAEAMLRYVFLEAILLGGERITLEVRPSNQKALALYSKLGFRSVGRRKGYYSDNGEDAIIMWRNLKEEQEASQG
ncbi:ribosomal-protein-alanine N-acetyltransferase [Heliorestis acidaminivorans]|uniref:Ribosomal-protein-alanine N-acetyltransferase n=1 Tax=Heliorestis acidaminivorans TaxID=553427 RepID=A0A6I0F0K3_9FIRM|nr:ribosomal protein S18-alanine N-acetyltransferase [Heliorestis acidaminivorans]KAB2951845.1 ribosomal-protein-alanine N-acetyltransferase [Heliorestis acidaminivorans]